MYTSISAVNNERILEENLLASSIIADCSTQLILQRNYQSASLAYNKAILMAKSDIMIFVHQDVYIPSGWQACLEKALTRLKDKPWAVLGIIGKNRNKEVVGRTWSTGLGCEVGKRIEGPVPVETIDELLIVVNKKSGIRFDENLPGFHLYGTDIVQTAIEMGYEAYVMDAPVIHNSLPVKKLGPDYAACYHYMQKKWKQRLPLDTLILPITYWGWPLNTKKIKQYFYRNHSRGNYSRLHDPSIKAKELGYER